MGIYVVSTILSPPLKIVLAVDVGRAEGFGLTGGSFMQGAY